MVACQPAQLQQVRLGSRRCCTLTGPWLGFGPWPHSSYANLGTHRCRCTSRLAPLVKGKRRKRAAHPRAVCVALPRTVSYSRHVPSLAEGPSAPLSTRIPVMESKPVVVAVIDGQPGGAPQQPAKGKGKWVAGAILLLCLGVGLGAGLGAGLKKKSTTASTPAPPTMTLYSVASSMTLAGLTSTTFTSAARLSFASTMATSLGVASSAVAVTQVTDITTARRRVLSTGVSVNFTVASTTP